MSVTRRAVLVGAGVALAAPALGASAAEALIKRIPATGEPIPAVGIGSWITFNVGDDPLLRAECRAVMAAFFEKGGGMVDSSPMYGSSQAVIGDALGALGHPAGLFSADKVWTDASDGPAQIAETTRRWGVQRFDLLQVHNLIDWEANLDTLDAMKAAGRLRYTGVTTSHGRRPEELEEVMRRRPPDFVQLTYNIVDREVERRLLPLALEQGIAVICNRAVPAGPAAGPARGPPATPMGQRDRSVHLAAVPAEVHYLAPRGHGRHSRNAAGRSRAREQVRRIRPHAGRRHAPAYGRLCTGSVRPSENPPPHPGPLLPGGEEREKREAPLSAYVPPPPFGGRGTGGGGCFSGRRDSVLSDSALAWPCPGRWRTCCCSRRKSIGGSSRLKTSQSGRRSRWCW